jgi:hypothetical protein
MTHLVAQQRIADLHRQAEHARLVADARDARTQATTGRRWIRRRQARPATV